MFDLRILWILVFGLVGGVIAQFIGVPMPYMLGAIFGSACFVLWYEQGDRQLPKLTRWVRLIFMSVIGTMIGSRFTPELLVLLPQFWLSIAALLPYILLAHGGGYAIMRLIGGYQKKDAYYAALPGGIVDSAVLAEAAGAVLRIVTAQHFIRIIMVVTSIPVLFFLITGEAVGSLAGETMVRATEYSVFDLLLILVIGFTGLTIGRLLRLPVSHMLGPLFLSLALTLTGTVEIHFPSWLGDLAQYMVGCALGAQFSGVSRKLLVRGLGMGLLAGTYMLSLAAGFAMILTQYLPTEFGVMFVSFAAGGLAEMSLIALSLNFNPIVVAIHHLVRITLTIFCGKLLEKYVR